ncbi:MAG: DEAD/DEAH box helicase, partial [Gemmatimonadota bacterium]
MILRAFERLVADLDLGARLPGPGEVLRLGDLPGVSVAGLAAALVRGGESPLVVVGPGPREAASVHADLEGLLGTAGARMLPQREALPDSDRDPHVEISAQRVETLAALLAGRVRALVVTGRSLVERDPVGTTDGDRFGLELEVGLRLPRGRLVGELERMGFERADTVRELGEFAVRSGIVDVFAFGHDSPLRIELWGDEIASLRYFDLLTQRSTERANRSEVLPIALPEARADGRPCERRALLDLLPSRTLMLELSPAACRDARHRLWAEIREARGSGGDPERLVVPPDEAERRIGEFRRITAKRADGELSAGEGGIRANGSRIDLGVQPPPVIDRDMARLAEVVGERTARDARTLILCDNTGQIERLEEILAAVSGRTRGSGPELAVGSVSGGCLIPGPAGILVLTDHEIFRRSRRLRRSRRFRGVATLESIASLSPGDYVVHMDHGIGRYLGLERVEAAGEAIETLKIEYAEGEILRVPHYRLDLIERYSGLGDADGARPPAVHRLGGRRWRAVRRRTEASIQAMAAELIELYAHRQVAKGFAFSPDTRWQKELESSFLYEDTPDQRAAWEDVRGDMESERIMDRLICGDVGYGKTEIAIRAAFKAVQDGRQVAVLAPTTILVEQHLHTFRERLAGFPVRVEALSRLRAPAEQRDVLAGLEEGSVDILLGTHRLLSPDVRFRGLGLLVVDEEQRFGVRHKERLKEMKRSIDVLSLTATPIPRTLQLALGGMRDLSRIETAPRDRMPVITHILSWS